MSSSASAVAETLQDRGPYRATPAAELVPLKLEFKGSAREYFRIWIVNLCLTLVTFGIFSAWAKVRKKRYLYSNTVLDGTPFQYLGQPVPILKGRIVATVFFATYYVFSHFLTDLTPYFLVPAAIVAPWFLVRTAAFNSRYSAYRNIRFEFQATYIEAARTLFAWGALPLLASFSILSTTTTVSARTALGFVFMALIFAFPLWMRSLKAFVVSHTGYGGKRGVFEASRLSYWVSYLVAGILMIAPIMAVLAIFTLPGEDVRVQMRNSELVEWGSRILIYLGYALGFAYLQSRITNLVWENSTLGNLQFRSHLTFFGMAGLYLSNALAILASAGMLIPWAVMRTQMYRAGHLEVFRAGELSEFLATRTQEVQAVGAETFDLFDLDISV